MKTLEEVVEVWEECLMNVDGFPVHAEAEKR